MFYSLFLFILALVVVVIQKKEAKTKKHDLLFLFLKLPGFIVINLLFVYIAYLNVFVFPLRAEALLSLFAYLIVFVVAFLILNKQRKDMKKIRSARDFVILFNPIVASCILWVGGILTDR
jgi:hypothetical protein